MNATRAFHRRRGFSLVELVIVLLILSILASVAAPRYVGALASFRATATAMRVAADLEMARREAKRTSADQTVEFYPAQERYVLAGMADLDRPGDTYEVFVDDPAYSATLVSATFGPGSDVTFNRFGQPDNAGSVVVQSGNRQRQINVDANGTITLP